ncbi:MAG: aldolase, partial [Deinococcus-Thermus bacterium]|nr:aldolase [Deinococcota bacterium]
MTQTLRARMRAGETLAGTFLKTPAHELIEVLAGSGLDFVCLDAEHAPFDRARTDAC